MDVTEPRGRCMPPELQIRQPAVEVVRLVPQSAVARRRALRQRKRAAIERRRRLIHLLLSWANRLAAMLVPWARRLATLAIMFVAGVMGLVTWDYYVSAPWTRDGRVRVHVASVAPQISGQITEQRIVDNQFVHKGDVLYVIDPFDFAVAVRTNKAMVEQKAADLQVKQVQSDRRQHLTNLATTPEEQQVFAGTALQAKAAFEMARQQLAQAEINLRRTEIRSPVSGYITNLLIGVGDYAQQGSVIVSVIDSESYWIDGYFEETKTARVCVGDRVEAKLMGYAQPVLGHVSTITRGISVSNASPSTQGLPNVDPVYTWVRLAQRVPVRITIDKVPPGVPLVAGMTATVTVLPPAGATRPNAFDATITEINARLADVFEGPPARPDCIPAIAPNPGRTQSLQVEVEEPSLTPAQINPGLAPGMSASPRNR
ncbi:multidrug transporter [Reyranella soli]|uniref:Multidrug transporter n=2 Tax=Reyranella soli TaxID=1230389 RepID=A0A512NLA5_9HYPH|nr:multidrug transporter [Reyranella soli]